LTIRPSVGKSLAFAAAACVLVCATGAASTGPVPAGPSTQIADRLEAPGQTSAQSPAAALYTTELHATNVEEASERDWEMEGSINRLPCKRHDYRFIATTAAIDDSQASMFETLIRVYSVNLPRGVRCESALATWGQVKVEIEPIAGPVSPPTRYSSGRVSIESFRSCVTLDHVCPGRYVLIAQLAFGDRRIRLVYAVAVIAAPGPQAP
jgi:hypothetical protein